MAHYPRWIEEDTVDTVAMYMAYLAYRQHCSPREQAALDALTIVQHKASVAKELFPIVNDLTQIGPLRHTQCTLEKCPRCMGGRGGYQFRWYDSRWYAEYVRTKRPYAWVLPSNRSGSESGKQHRPCGAFWKTNKDQNECRP